jgi:dolichyl-phosphate-mannose-protein mannosyltransferase
LAHADKRSTLQLVRPEDDLSRRGIVVVCLLIFFIAVGVRLLHWQNNWLTIDENMWRLTARYKEDAQFLVNGHIRSFVRGNTREPDTGLLMHTPGYPILISVVEKISGNSQTSLRIFHILCGAATAVLVFLIASNLLPSGAAIIAGLLVAVSPQLSFNSLLLLPDTITTFPILLAMLLIVRARERPRVIMMIVAGMAIGVSCWLRANALLLSPFLAVLILVLFGDRRWTYAACFVTAALLVIAPITIRNALLYQSFLPLSLGSGVILVEGIADYDADHRFGFEKYDDDLCHQEAQLYNRPDYADDLFKPDGIKRERARRDRAQAVILSNKLWYFGVMARRAVSMLDYQQVSIISTEPSITHRMELTGQTKPTFTISVAADKQALQIKGNDSSNGVLFTSAPISIKTRSDYLVRIPLQLEQGRMVIRVERVDNGNALVSATIPDSLTKESMSLAQMAFVSDAADQIRIVVANAQIEPLRSIMQIRDMEVFELGPASYLWTRYPRTLVKSIQKFFVTRWMLPLALVGCFVLALSRQWSTLAIILAVPTYYLSVHSPLHVEPRYVLAMQYFFLMLVAVTLYWGGSKVLRLIRTIRPKQKESTLMRINQ